MKNQSYSKPNCLVLLFVTLFISSCFKVQKKREAEMILSQEERDELIQTCQQLNSQGDMMKLLKEIKNETDNVFEILDSGMMLEKKDQLTKLSESINKKAFLVTSMSRTEWVNPRFEYTASWLISSKDFRDLAGAHLNGGLKFLDLKLSHVILSGQKRDDLKEHIEIKKNDETVYKISFQQAATALEMCQLNQTLMVVVELDYKNVINKNNRFFNLVIENNFNLK